MDGWKITAGKLFYRFDELFGKFLMCSCVKSKVMYIRNIFIN